jgi:hypothetical protein
MRVIVKINPTEVEIDMRTVGQPKDIAQVLDLVEAFQVRMSGRLSQENVELLNARTAAMQAQSELVKIELEAHVRRQREGE